MKKMKEEYEEKIHNLNNSNKKLEIKLQNSNQKRQMELNASKKNNENLTIKIKEAKGSIKNHLNTIENQAKSL